MMCDCPGKREFEPLDEYEDDGSQWYVCSCCGTKTLVSPVIEVPEVNEPDEELPPIDMEIDDAQSSGT